MDGGGPRIFRAVQCTFISPLVLLKEKMISSFAWVKVHTDQNSLERWGWGGAHVFVMRKRSFKHSHGFDVCS